MPLSKRASLEAQRMMREAFMELERVIMVSDRAQLKNVTLEDVQQAALRIEKQLAASQSLRNMRRLAPLFTGLEHFSQTIEVLCNGTPYLPWLWAPIKLILKISSDYIEAFEQIIKVYSRLAEPLARFSLFSHSFSNNIEVQKTLAVYYSDILKFHGEAYKFVRRNAWQRLFATSWGRFQRRFNHIFADLKAHEDLVDKTAIAANLSESKDMREKLQDWRQQEINKLKQEEEDRASNEFHAILSVLKVDETHQIKVFDSLVAEANQNPGSCSWILQQPKIQSWARCDRATQFAVMHGCVGSGKSVLATQIQNFLRSSDHSMVASHFCTYLYPESTNYNFIIRSLMIQIMRSDPDLITLSYDWLVLKRKTPNNAILEQLLRLLVEALGAMPSQQKALHIVIDGLDECDGGTVADIVRTLDKLIATASSSGTTILKVLLCTQMTPAVAKVVKKKHQISLSNERNHLNKAIQDYTLQRINTIRPSLSQLRITDDDVAALASRITQKADGMFLWAKLVMEYINTNLFHHRDEILEAAHSLPRELGKFYGRILSQIMANFDERSVQRIRAVFSWIAFAKRPLRSAELLSALAFDAGHEQVNELVPAYILDRCEPLIQKQVDSSYSFIHMSVRDFLQGSDSGFLITENESQRRHGLATVRCLLSSQQTFDPSYSEAKRTLRILRGLHGFHIYATEFWVDYLLTDLKFDQSCFFKSNFFQLSCLLVDNFTGAKPDLETVDSGTSDPWLALIRQKHYPLYEIVKMMLLEQKKGTLETVSTYDVTIQHNVAADGIISLKKKYQMMIRKILNYSTYPEVTFQELEQFKQNFRTSAFTCRLQSCPHAALGFSNHDCLMRHEMGHLKHVCRVQGCQYPAFNSARMLKNHEAMHHAGSEQTVVRKSIRKHPKRQASPRQGNHPALLFDNDRPDSSQLNLSMNDVSSFSASNKHPLSLLTNPPSPSVLPPKPLYSTDLNGVSWPASMDTDESEQQPQQQAQQTQQQTQQKNQPAHFSPLNLDFPPKMLSFPETYDFTTYRRPYSVSSTITRPPSPFSTGAPLPHGSPIHMSGLEDLDMPVLYTGMKQKIASGQHSSPPSQEATPSPQIAKTVTPDIRRHQDTPTSLREVDDGFGESYATEGADFQGFSATVDKTDDFQSLFPYFTSTSLDFSETTYPDIFQQINWTNLDI